MKKDKKKTPEEIVQEFTLMDDAFAEKVFEDEKVCEEVLRVILKDNTIEVESSVTQKAVRNLNGRSVRADVYCRFKSGKLCNIEIQQKKTDNQLKRVRYNAACITTSSTHAGSKFITVPDLVVVYISKFDIFSHKKVIYRCCTMIEGISEKVQNGLEEVYVNTKVNDKEETLITELMSCFKKKEFNNPKFPKLSERVNYFKHNEGGIKVMCKLIQEYGNDVRVDAIADCVEILKRLGQSAEKIIDEIMRQYKLSEEEARKFLQ